MARLKGPRIISEQKQISDNSYRGVRADFFSGTRIYIANLTLQAFLNVKNKNCYELITQSRSFVGQHTCSLVVVICLV
jgi:hypothetical protein